MLRARLSALLLSILLTGGSLLIPPGLHADPIADLAKYSVFSSVDLSSLSSGNILAVRGPGLSFARDLSVQALYLVHAPVPRTLQLHQQWDPGKHPELKVYLHHDFSTRPTLADFTQPIPGNGAVRKLAEATEKLPALDQLQLSKAEAAAFKNSGGNGAYSPAVASFWSQVLFQRASAFLGHGLSALPPYDSADGSAHVAEEVSRLLGEQPKVRAAFGPIISHSPLSGGIGSLPLSPYWELFDVEGQANFSLGASSSIQTGDTAQMVDLQYYAGGGYYVYLTIYQMSPVTVDGKPATLVWRVDSISSLDLGDLNSFDKMGSGAAMSKDIQRIVKDFKKDVGL